MGHDRLLRLALAGLWMTSFAACAYAGSSGRTGLPDVIRPAAGVARFEPGSPELRIQPGDTVAGDGCLNPLFGEGGVRAVLVRSAAGFGDYRVPEGFLGVGEGEVLRVECNTGEVRGVARG